MEQPGLTENGSFFDLFFKRLSGIVSLGRLSLLPSIFSRKTSQPGQCSIDQSLLD